MPNQEKTLEAILAIAGGLLVAHFLTGHIAFLFVCMAITTLGLLSVRTSRYVAWVWYKIGEGLNFVSSRMLLTLVYFLILTPVALLSRIGKKDSLTLRKPAVSNWSDRNHQYQQEDLENVW